MLKFSKPRFSHRPDYVFLICVAVLVVFGLIMLSSASSDLGKLKFNDTYYYLKHQIFYGLTFGILGFLLTSFLYYKNIQRIAVLLLAFNIILLILVFTPLGIHYNKGASRWLEIGSISLQPAELLKISFIIYLAAWLSNAKKRRQSFYEGFLPFLAITCLIAILVFIQPATTTFIIVMLSAIIIYFLSGVKLSHIAEELGFIGSIFTILIFSILILRGFQIARKSSDRFGYLTAFGLTSVIAIQAFVHIGSISGLIPLTGVTLPFISYGGTSLAVFLTMAGIIGNISKYT